MSAENTETRQKSCEERLPAQQSGRLEDFRALLKRSESNDDEDREAAQEEIYEYPLAVSEYRTVRIDLSTGGPADWLEITLDGDEPQRIEYHFSDWFDHASATLEGDDFDAADTFARQITADYYTEPQA